MNDFNNKTVLVTGDSGFLGRYVVDELLKKGAIVYGISKTPPKKTCSVLNNYYPSFINLMNANKIYNIFDSISANNSIDYIIHCAGYNGGIQFNIDNPMDIFINNTLMAINILTVAKIFKVKKVVSIIASCAYPGDSCNEDKGILFENKLQNGPPNLTVAAHGYAKRNLQNLSSFMSVGNMRCVTVCPTTLMGPGDSLSLKNTKVGMAVIKKIVDAQQQGKDSVEFMGSGYPLREFVDVRDAAKYILSATIKYSDYTMPLNIGSGHEHSISNYVGLVANIANYKGVIRWDEDKPDGAYRKKLDLTRMKQYLPDLGITPLGKTIRDTIIWYKSLQ